MAEIYSKTSESPPRNEHKIIEELQTTAAFAEGISRYDGVERWVRLPQKNESSPDTYVVEIHPYTPPGKSIKAQQLIEHPVEVVAFNEFSTEDFLDFLKRTKLGKKYPESFTLLCLLSKDQEQFDLKKASDKLKKLGLDFTIGIIAKTSLDDDYTAALLSPDYHVCPSFNLKNIAKISRKDVVTLKRGAKTGFIPYAEDVRLIKLIT